MVLNNVITTGMLLLTLSFLLLGADTSFAASGNRFEIDVSAVGSSPAGNGFQKAIGVNFGAGMMLNDARTIQARLDFSPLDWEKRPFGTELHHKRLVTSLSGRIYKATYFQPIRLFGQLGVEVSADKKEALTGAFIKTTENKTNLGLTPAVGIDLGLGQDLSFTVSGRYHAITDSYFDVMAGVAVHF